MPRAACPCRTVTASQASRISTFFKWRSVRGRVGVGCATTDGSSRLNRQAQSDVRGRVAGAAALKDVLRKLLGRPRSDLAEVLVRSIVGTTASLALRLSRRVYASVPASLMTAIAALTDAVVPIARGFWKLHDRLRAEGRLRGTTNASIACTAPGLSAGRTTTGAPSRATAVDAPPVSEPNYGRSASDRDLYDRLRFRLRPS